MAGTSASLAAPTLNTGAQAQAALFAAQGLEAFKKAMMLADVSSPLGQALADAIKRVGKEVGSVPQGTQQASLVAQLAEARRNALQRTALMQMQQSARPPAPGGVPGVPGGSPAAGTPPTAAMAA